MDEERFEEIWERAEAEHYGQRLAAEYPAWRTRRNRMAGMAMLTLAAVGIALPLWQTSLQPAPQEEGYTVAYCNSLAIAGQSWANMADELLMNI
jgi:ferric-dicitrate binding protein FerR (iron transport regulator)